MYDFNSTNNNYLDINFPFGISLALKHLTSNSVAHHFSKNKNNNKKKKIKYIWTPVFRTLKGNEKQFEIAAVRNSR